MSLSRKHSVYYHHDVNWVFFIVVFYRLRKLPSIPGLLSVFFFFFLLRNGGYILPNGFSASIEIVFLFQFANMVIKLIFECLNCVFQQFMEGSKNLH